MMRGRAALAGLLGFVGGAAAGLLAALLFVHLWFDVFHLPPLNDDPKPGIAMLGWTVPIWTLTGGLSGATAMVRRVRAGRSARAFAVPFALSIALVLVGLVLIVS